MRRYGEVFSRLLLTLWVGGLWVVGYLVVPILFSSLDRMLAGAVAGKLFTAIAWLGLVVAALFLISSADLQGGDRSRWPVIWLLLVMAAINVFQLFLIQPEIARVKLLPDGFNSEIFKRWHAVASIVYLLQSLLGIVLLLWSSCLSRQNNQP